MSESTYFLTLGLFLGTLLLVFALRYAAASRQAAAQLARDDALRRIAEQSASAQAETAASLAALQSAVTETRQRLAAIEKVLKEVE